MICYNSNSCDKNIKDGAKIYRTRSGVLYCSRKCLFVGEGIIYGLFVEPKQ